MSSIGTIFTLLTVLVTPICILASYNTITHSYGQYLMLLISLELVLVLLFSTSSIMSFYVLFELALLPLYMLIGSYGASTERLRASVLLWVYTFFGSLSMLIGIVWLVLMTGSTDLTMLPQYGLQLVDSRMVWLLLAIGIANKIPNVPLHIWLPRAHVEASISASIILAAIVLKLSTYATLVLLINVLPGSASYHSALWLSLGLISYLHASLATITQIDSKTLIAYSSVSHMAIITIGLHSNSILGIVGGMILAIAHASSSAALFIIFGQVLYDRLHTRTLYYLGNIASYAPSLRSLLFLSIFANSATPLSVNWLAEFYVLTGIASTNWMVTVILGTTIITTALYSFWMYSYVLGTSVTSTSVLLDANRMEVSTLLYVLVPNFVLGISLWLIEPSLTHSAVCLLY